MITSMTGRAALVLTGVASLTLPLAAAGAATAAGEVPAAAVHTAYQGKKVTERDAGVLAAHLLDQELTWETCEWPGQLSSVAEMLDQIPGTACATVTVPRDWNNPTDGHTVEVRISKTETAGADRKGMALVNPGGPSAEGVIWGPGMAMMAPELAEHYDFYGFDPRGVGESTNAVCTYTPDFSLDQWGLDKAMVEGCLANPLAKFVNSEQTAYDMDFVRALMGEDKLSYIGFSYGTWLGSWYQRLFPQNADKFLLDSATDLTRKSLQETWDLQPRSRDRQFQEALLPYVARHHDKFGAGTDPLQIRADWEAGGGTRTFLGSLLTEWYVIPAMYSTRNYPQAASIVAAVNRGEALPKDDDCWWCVEKELVDLTGEAKEIAAAAGADTAFLDKALENALADLKSPTTRAGIAAAGADARWGTVSYDLTFELIRCQDGQWNTSRDYWDSWLADLGNKAPWIAPFMTAPACAHFDAPTEMPKHPGKTAPSTLMIQSELDAATPYEAGQRSAKLLKNTALISVDNEGSHGLYPYGTTCVDDAVYAYFVDGVLPAATTACQAKPLPMEAETFEVGGELGKKGTIKLKMRTPAVKEATRLFHEMIADGTATS